MKIRVSGDAPMPLTAEDRNARPSMTSPDTGRAGEVRLSLPFPPSINRLYRAVGGRSILSAEYRAWKAEAGALLMSQRPKKLLGRVGVRVELKAPDNRRRDADNAGTKAVLDLLVAHQIIEGDDSRFVRSVEAKWVDDGDPCTVTVRGNQ